MHKRAQNKKEYHQQLDIKRMKSLHSFIILGTAFELQGLLRGIQEKTRFNLLLMTHLFSKDEFKNRLNL